MKRNLAVVGAVLAAMLAAGALAASSALAIPQFGAIEYPMHISGQQVGGELTFKFEKGTLETKCPVAKFGGGEIAAASAEMKGVTAEYKGEGEKTCKAFGLNATVSMNECTYTLHVEKQVVENLEYTGTYAISCPAGKKIVIVTATCEVQIGAQSGLVGDLYSIERKTPAEPDAFLNFTNLANIEYNKTKDGIGCPLKGLGVENNGAYAGETTGICLNHNGERIECKLVG